MLDQAVEALRYSEERCRLLVSKETYTQAEFEHLEALTARFARTVDILTQKVFKTLFFLLGEDVGTFLDAANLAEKLGLVAQADDLVTLRTLRNEISHEYATEKLNEIFAETVSLLDTLYSIIEKTKGYARDKLGEV